LSTSFFNTSNYTDGTSYLNIILVTRNDVEVSLQIH
jgi:hypothetical protein